MTKFLPLLAASLAAAGAVAAQSFGEQVLGALRQNNLTALADVVLANPSLVEALQSSGNKTVLAPTNAALQAAGELPSGNDLVRLITYHVLNGTWTNDRIDDERIAASTLLTDGVRLPGNRSQVVILDSQGDDDNERSFVIGTSSNVSFASGSDGPSLAQILVQPISGVLSIPQGLSATLANVSQASSLVAALQQANLVDALDGARGLTVFVPNNGAFQAVQQAVGSATPEQVTAVLSNHVINGTVVYSYQLEGDNRIRNATSASGQQLSFEEEDDTLYVRSGEVRARIVRSDYLTNNGVVHVIDQVLLNTATNQTAADSAASSAADVAQTAAPPGSTGTTGSGSGSGSSSGGSPDGASQLARIGVAGLLAVVASAAFTLA